MTDTNVIQLALQTIILAGKLGAPILLTSLGIGVLVSVVQSVTQVQEVTLTFVPKLAGIAIVILVSGHWMLGELTSFTRDLFALLPNLVGS